MTTGAARAGGLLLAALLAASGVGRAEQPKGDPGDRGRQHRFDRPDRAQREKMRQQLMDQLRTMRMWKLTEELKLDEATAAKLFPLLSKYDDRERQLFRERGHTYRELRQAIEAAPGDAVRIDAVAEKLARNRDRRHALEQEKYLALRKVVTAAQMGKLLLLMPRIEDEFRQKIREAIEAGRARRAADAAHSETPRRVRSDPAARE